MMRGLMEAIVTTMELDETRWQQVGDNVRWVRRRMHFSQKQLAERLGLSRATINRIENGRAQMRMNKLEQLAVLSGMPIEYLLYGPDYPRIESESQEPTDFG